MRHHIKAARLCRFQLGCLTRGKLLQAVGGWLPIIEQHKNSRDPVQDCAVHVASREALPWAAQLAIVVGDVTPATLEIIEVCITIASVTCPATCDQIVSPHVDIGASLLVGAARSSAISVSVTIIVWMGIGGAAQMAIIVGDVTAAAFKLIELGISPISAARLATSPQIIACNPDIAAGLAVGSARPAHVVIIVAPASVV
jgi:hypothetical protein